MNLLKTAGNLDDKIGELQYSAEKCNFMLENLCNTFGQIMDDNQKANNWDAAGVMVDIAQDYARRTFETTKEANKLINQLFNEAREIERPTEGGNNDAPQVTATQADFKSGIVEMLNYADARKMRSVYVFTKALLGDDLKYHKQPQS
ncbi:Uncharacterised protein [Fusicatenibacter saccharivorans]|uniref:Uncharacterized protein n=1 Tax=Fusicatenibacter saccharivorans TaxID=1150298 RepID=A0A174DK55_9FIRM|nr:hypothetical protein [Fusicatenibacter saccharivorans]CUO24280.1 Uncharacterised protein [Fusicatenibacter saccharivorans]